MTRDMDLVRKILLAIEAQPGGYAPENFEIDGYTEEQIGYHVLLMIEGGLVDGVEDSSFGQSSPSGNATRLTWKGHEFLEAARQPAIWERGKALAARAGSSSFTVLVEALTRAALQALDN